MKNYKVTTTTGDGASTETVMQLPELGDPCAKCGLNPSTQEVTIMVEHSGGTAYYCDECAKGPGWTASPPTESGCWWARKNKNSEPEMVELWLDEEGPCVSRVGDTCVFGPHEFALWWPVPIKRPV